MNRTDVGASGSHRICKPLGGWRFLLPKLVVSATCASIPDFTGAACYCAGAPAAVGRGHKQVESTIGEMSLGNCWPSYHSYSQHSRDFAVSLRDHWRSKSVLTDRVKHYCGFWPRLTRCPASRHLLQCHCVGGPVRKSTC